MTDRPTVRGPEIVPATPTLADDAPQARETIIGRETRSQTATFDASGVAEVVFGPAPNFAYWLIDAITVTTDSANATTARVYVGAAVDSNLRDATEQGNLDISDRAQPILVSGGATLRIRWTGGAAGDTATAVIQLAVARVE